MSKYLEIRNAGHVRTIVINRPEKKNALNHELAWSILNAVEEAWKDDSVWVIAITGTGDAFCSGLDLGGPGEHTPLSEQEQCLDDIGWVGRIPLLLRQTCDKLIIAGVNGVAVGAGLSLALAADIRIAAQGARFKAGYPHLGASPDGGMTWTLPQLVGYEQAMRFLLANKSITAEEALRIGMVGEVVPDGKFDDRLTEYCAFLAERSPITTRLTKRSLVMATTAVDLELLVRFELANVLKAFQTKDSQKAITAFLKKQHAEFEGC